MDLEVDSEIQNALDCITEAIDCEIEELDHFYKRKELLERLAAMISEKLSEMD